MADPEDEMTDASLNQPATKRDIVELRHDFAEHRQATKQDIEELRQATKQDLAEVRDELRSHFDVVAEKFRSDFANLFDWTQSTTSTLGERVDGVESRVSGLERRRK